MQPGDLVKNKYTIYLSSMLHEIRENRLSFENDISLLVSNYHGSTYILTPEGHGWAWAAYIQVI